MKLDECAILYETDKSNKGHFYTQYYEIFFESLRDKEINLLEIGIDKGASLRMWADYFENGTIVGLDIDDKSQYRTDKIDTAILDQSSKEQLEQFGKEYDQCFDIVIDDGSHESNHQILTFEVLFPYLKQGGLYCCEDLLCDFDSRWNKGKSSIEYFKSLISDVNMGGQISNYHICANKKEQVKKYSGTYFELNIEWVFNSCGLCIIKKL